MAELRTEAKNGASMGHLYPFIQLGLFWSGGFWGRTDRLNLSLSEPSYRVHWFVPSSGLPSASTIGRVKALDPQGVVNGDPFKGLSIDTPGPGVLVYISSYDFIDGTSLVVVLDGHLFTLGHSTSQSDCGPSPPLLALITVLRDLLDLDR